MATALGVAAPAGGETGTVDKVTPLPDQLPDNRAELAHTTSIETISQVLYQNYIWTNTYTIDSSMLPGHVFGIKKVHPYECNDYVKYMSMMFISWAGSMILRIRFMATFQFGGSFRVGFLPPKFTEDEILNMPIQTLTAYPNVDLDPKNTGWVNFRASDERNVLFHWLSDLTNNDPQSFGGYFVFYVAAPLVVSGGTPSTVSLLVESAGDFDFTQLAPLTRLTPGQFGWVGEQNMITMTGGDDQQAITHIQINPIAVTSIGAGCYMSKAIGNLYSTAVTSASTTGPLCEIFRTRTADNFIPVVTFCKGSYTSPRPGFAGDGVYTTLNDGMTFVLNASKDAIQSITGALTAHSTNKKFNTALDPTEAIKNIYGAADDVPSTHEGYVASGVPVFAPVFDPTTVSITGDITRWQNPLEESIITFNNMNFSTVNLQTRQVGEQLSLIPTYNPDVSQVYQMYTDASPNPILTVRLQPNGAFTTRAVDAPAVLRSKKIYLRYLQDLPMTTPLPPAYTERRFLNAAIKATSKGYITAGQQKVHLFSNF